MSDWNSCPAVERSPNRLSGAWVFRKTRVPVKALFENLEDGATVDQFLEWFPGVTREQALAVLEFATPEAGALRIADEAADRGFQILDLIERPAIHLS
jgi:uncharacterized protein (DUF433 family)